MDGKTRKRFGVATGAVAGILLAGEIGLRAFLGLGNPPLSHADPDYGYAFNGSQDLKRFGNRVFYNEHGLRSAPLSAPKPAGEFRVLCVGDSVTNGGVLTDQSQTYPYLLEAKLRRAGMRAVVLNASAGSWGVENELAWLKKKGLFESDVVVLQIGSHDLAQRKSTGDKVGQDVSLPDRRPLLAYEELIGRYVAPRVAQWVRQPQRPGPPSEQDHWACMSAISEMVTVVRAGGASPVILLTPDRGELDQPSRFQQWRQDLIELAEASNVPLVDMLAVFQCEADRGHSAFRDGVHPNGRGNLLLARAVAERIESFVRATGGS